MEDEEGGGIVSLQRSWVLHAQGPLEILFLLPCYSKWAVEFGTNERIEKTAFYIILYFFYYIYINPFIFV